MLIIKDTDRFMGNCCFEYFGFLLQNVKGLEFKH